MKKSECFSVHSLEEMLRSSTLFEATGEIFRAVILFPRWDISRIWYATDKYSTMQRCLCDAIHEKFRDNCLYIHEIFLDPISNNATKYSAVRYCFYITMHEIFRNATNEIFCDTIFLAMWRNILQHDIVCVSLQYEIFRIWWMKYFAIQYCLVTLRNIP